MSQDNFWELVLSCSHHEILRIRLRSPQVSHKCLYPQKHLVYSDKTGFHGNTISEVAVVPAGQLGCPLSLKPGHSVPGAGHGCNVK